MKDRLIWCDLETTGLDPDEDLLLEVGFKITDLELNVIADIQTYVWAPEYIKRITEGNIEPFVWKMHKKSYLFQDAAQNPCNIWTASTKVDKWLKANNVTNDEPLCGSSVQFDRGWLQVWMPQAIKQFSYRNIDISTLKELCRRYNPELYAKLNHEVPSRKLHRALPDLDDTIAEFKFYRDSFLFWKD